jgi:5,10-methylenetetrahydromethanopterin reductase
VDYIREAVDLLRQGAERAGKSLADVDRPELLVCCLSDEDPEAAMMEGKSLVAYYLGTEPHIMKASQVDEALIKKVQEFVGWPASEEDYRRAAKLIPDEVVRNLMAVGTSEECRAKVAEYIAAGVTCPILYPMMDDIKPVIDAFADWEPS